MSTPATVSRVSCVLVAENTEPPPSEVTLDTHCGVFHHLARTLDFDHMDFKIDKPHTRVGWRKCGSGKVELVVELRVTSVRLGESWIAPDFYNLEHRRAVNALDAGPWLRYIDAHLRAWLKKATVRFGRPKSKGEPCCYSFRVAVLDGAVPDKACNLLCAVLQRLVLDQPPMCATAQFNPATTKVGWVRGTGNDILLKVRVQVLELLVGNKWVTADYSEARHRELAQALDLQGWFCAQNARARALIRKLSSA